MSVSELFNQCGSFHWIINGEKLAEEKVLIIHCCRR